MEAWGMSQGNSGRALTSKSIMRDTKILGRVSQRSRGDCEIKKKKKKKGLASVL